MIHISLVQQHNNRISCLGSSRYLAVIILVNTLFPCAYALVQEIGHILRCSTQAEPANQFDD